MLKKSIGKLYPQRLTIGVFLAILAGFLITLAVFPLPPHSFAQGLGEEASPEQWDEIALMRFQAGQDHEQLAQNNEPLLDVTPAEALDAAGDEKFLASGQYKTASEHWEKVAKAYETIGEANRAHKARSDADKALEAAKRTLQEGSILHMRAAKEYGSANNLVRKVNALEKAARNLEHLMKMK